MIAAIILEPWAVWLFLILSVATLVTVILIKLEAPDDALPLRLTSDEIVAQEVEIGTLKAHVMQERAEKMLLHKDFETAVSTNQSLRVRIKELEDATGVLVETERQLRQQLMGEEAIKDMTNTHDVIMKRNRAKKFTAHVEAVNGNVILTTGSQCYNNEADCETAVGNALRGAPKDPKKWIRAYKAQV